MFIPESQSIVRVSIISPNRVLGVPADAFLKPTIPGTTYNDTPCLCFLIEHDDGQETSRLLFDLGIPRNLDKAPPTSTLGFPPVLFRADYRPVTKAIREMGITVETPKTIAELLAERDLVPSDINAVILSHGHFDHVGDLGEFPPSTKLIVGPGFTQQFLPGYPINPESAINQHELDARDIQELDFLKQDTEIESLKAIDLFLDGSFYLLNTPGHAVGHISALARTTTSLSPAGESTFLLLAGDVCHHAGALRPSALNPLYMDKLDEVESDIGRITYVSKIMEQDGVIARPFYAPACGGFNMDACEMAATLRSIHKFDASANILVLLAHDYWLKDTLAFFPESANSWKEKGWKAQTYWRFLRDFE